ncbi:unnamed protein product [Nippostrongylus brasiliensis]|uniref:Alpha-catulin (inferred by orthology to a human protein) n=1 Tax=Nippostrongylus brasiliensis TaxID=27835 RepID=A0A0N4XIB9_NIPBR|nr:unnamed protein product [Nippostrongylus brasiliensis]
MSSMAYNMYLFTRGDGPLKTTHDLFTQAEFFAEQANKMYKTVREFSYEVPGSAEKSELSAILERIPVHCQQLQVLVKSPTYEIEFRGGSVPRTVGDGGDTRASRESTLWRRTPSIRRTAPPHALFQHQH